MPSTLTRSIERRVRVVAVEGGDVDDGLAALDRTPQRVRVEQVGPLGTDVGALSASSRATWLPTKPVAPVT